MSRLKLFDPNVERLTELGQLCRTARNAATEDWLLRQRGKPMSEAQSGRGKTGAEKAESTKVYHAITASVPMLATQVAAKIASQLCSYLSAKVDWRKQDGKQMRRRDAILAYKDRPPFASHLTIELPCSTTTVEFTDRLSVQFLAERGKPDIVEIATSGLTAGQKLLIRRCLDGGDLKLADSTIAVRDNKWFWMLPIQIPRPDEPDAGITCDLWPQIPDDEPDRLQHRPYRMVMPDGRRFYIGDGRYLESQTRRLLVLMKQIGWRYRQRSGAGHGRQKIDGSVRRRRTQLRNIVDEVRRRAIADIVRNCERNRCGTIVWHEPSLPLREKCWWAVNKLDWDWTRFTNDLRNAAARSGIVVSVSRFKFSEWKEHHDNLSAKS